MLTVLNMSLTASIVIIFVLLARLLLKKAPKSRMSTPPLYFILYAITLKKD